MKHLDKITHYSVSFMLAAVFSYFMPTMYAVILSFAIGVCREAYNKYKGGKFDLYDMSANITGILTFLMVDGIGNI